MLRAQANPGENGDGGFSTEDFVCDEVTGINCYTFSDRVKTRLQEIGVGDQSERPRLAEDHKGVFQGLEPGDYFNGRLPVVIRRLSLDQLSALYSLFSRWYGYLVFQTNLIAAERSEASKQKEFLWSHIRKQYLYNENGKKNSPQIMSDLARGDFRFVKANAMYEELNVLYNCMQATLEVTEQDMKVISREVTIVQAKQEHDYTGGGFQGRARRPWSQGGGDGEANKDNAGPGNTGPSARGRRPVVVNR